jgi:hypothetical protein
MAGDLLVEPSDLRGDVGRPSLLSVRFTHRPVGGLLAGATAIPPADSLGTDRFGSLPARSSRSQVPDRLPGLGVGPDAVPGVQTGAYSMRGVEGLLGLAQRGGPIGPLSS